MTDTTHNPTDFVTVFQLDGQPVRGRAVKLGPAIDKALNPGGNARYPDAIARLLGEAMMTGAIVAQSLKFDGRLVVQYQGIAAIEGESLSSCAEHYFNQSEQIPTRIHLACGQAIDAVGSHWSGGGIMIQKIADDEARADTTPPWETAQQLFATLTDAELIDPEVSTETLLYRLFNEFGVRVVETHNVNANCRCSRDRLLDTLKSFDAAALQDMADDGVIAANCEFCATDYKFPITEI